MSTIPVTNHIRKNADMNIPVYLCALKRMLTNLFIALSSGIFCQLLSVNHSDHIKVEAAGNVNTFLHLACSNVVYINARVGCCLR